MAARRCSRGLRGLGSIVIQGGVFNLGMSGSGTACTSTDCPDGVILKGGGITALEGLHVNPRNCGGLPAKIEVIYDANDSASDMTIPANPIVANKLSNATSLVTISGWAEMRSWNVADYLGSGRGTFRPWVAVADTGSRDTGDEVCNQMQTQCQDTWVMTPGSTTDEIADSTCATDQANDAIMLVYCR